MVTLHGGYILTFENLCLGQAMGIFYILSGLVMYVGYAQKLLAEPVDSTCGAWYWW
jgi:hypothetical protein